MKLCQTPYRSATPPKRYFRQIHWLTWFVPLVTLLSTCIYILAASNGYTHELAFPGFQTGSQIALQRFEDEYLNELSRYLIEQFQRELTEISKKMQENIDSNRQLYSEENIRRLAKEELDKKEVKHSGVDYASVFEGCKILKHSPTHSFGSEKYKLWHFPVFKLDREPELILHRISDNLTPGFCWPFKDNSGYVVLQLQEPVEINKIVYSHVDRSAESAHLFKSSPKTIEVWGGVELEMLKFLGETKLQNDQSSATITIHQPKLAKYIKFLVTENNGAEFTCLYRVSVYSNSTSSEKA